MDKPGSTFGKISPGGDIYYLESVPPTYKTLEKKVIITPASVRVIDTPAVYGTVSKQKLIRPEDIDWVEILCENNASPSVIKDIQISLKKNNFPPGREDGKLDQPTLDAINRFQKANGLKVNNNRVINMETVKALNIKLN